MTFAFETTANHTLCIRIEANRLYGANAYILETETRSRLNGIQQIQIDCAAIRLIDSSGLVGLITLAKLQAKQGQPKIRLMNLHASVDRLMRLSHLDKVFDIPLDTAHST